MGNPAEQQPDKDLFRGSISKKEWRRKASSALSSSLPLWLLQHPCLQQWGGAKGAATQVLLGQQGCECINPFLGTPDSYKGDPDSLCKSAKKCFIPCDADCGDIQNTSNASRCESRLACNWL